MKFSDEEIRNILELKEEITEKIVKCQEQIEKLEKSLSAVDTILKQSSFTKASEIISNSSDTKKEEIEYQFQLQKILMEQLLQMRLFRMIRFQLFWKKMLHLALKHPH